MGTACCVTLPAGLGAAVGVLAAATCAGGLAGAAALPLVSDERLLVPSGFSRTFASSPSIQIDLR